MKWKAWTEQQIEAVRPFIHVTMTAADEKALSAAIGRTTTAVRLKVRDLRAKSTGGYSRLTIAEKDRLAPWVTGKAVLTDDNATMLAREFGRSAEAVKLKISELRQKIRLTKTAQAEKPELALKPSPFVIARTCPGCGDDFTAHRAAARLFCDRCRRS